MNYINTNTVLGIAQGVPHQNGKICTNRSKNKYKAVSQYPNIQAGSTTNYESQM